MTTSLLVASDKPSIPEDSSTIVVVGTFVSTNFAIEFIPVKGVYSSSHYTPLPHVLIYNSSFRDT